MTTRRRAVEKTPEEEIAELMARRPPRNQAKRGAYKATAPPEYFADRERAKQNIIDTLNLVMLAKDLTAADLAKLMGLSLPAVRHRMYGRSLFTADEIWAIAQRVGIDVSVLMDVSMPIAEKVKAIKAIAVPADS